MSIQDKIDAFKKMIDDPYNSGKWDKDILALSLQGVSDEMIKKTIDKKKYLTSDFLKMNLDLRFNKIKLNAKRVFRNLKRLITQSDEETITEFNNIILYRKRRRNAEEFVGFIYLKKE